MFVEIMFFYCLDSIICVCNWERGVTLCTTHRETSYYNNMKHMKDKH